MAHVLEDLVAELEALRMPAGSHPVVHGAVAQSMVTASSFYGQQFITPMAAVAGAVADHVVNSAMNDDLARLTVNNGGDIAFALSRGVSTTIGLVTSPTGLRLEGAVTIDGASPVRGVATSGWRGRSFSLGIADAVTVLARDAATADAAATAIASLIDLPGHPAVERAPANHLDANSDLGSRLVTTGVGQLTERERRRALAPGSDLVHELLQREVINAALLILGETWVAIHPGSRELFVMTQAPLAMELGSAAPQPFSVREES